MLALGIAKESPVKGFFFMRFSHLQYGVSAESRFKDAIKPFIRLLIRHISRIFVPGFEVSYRECVHPNAI